MNGCRNLIGEIKVIYDVKSYFASLTMRWIQLIPRYLSVLKLLAGISKSCRCINAKEPVRDSG